MPHSSSFQLELFPTAEIPEPTDTVAQKPAVPTPTASTPAGETSTTPTTPAQLASTLQPSPRQSDKPELAREALLLRLGELMPDRLGAITLTNNRTSIISARDKGGQLDLRIHRSFALASDEILQAVATFLLSQRQSAARRGALATIRAYFQSHQSKTPVAPRPPRRIVLRPVGRIFDLVQLRDAVNHRYFDGKLAVDITWGRAPSRRKRRKGCGFSVRLGTYSERDNLVRIHPCLDQKKVPRYVVEAVVHHEMLHAAIPAVVVGGRRRVHTPEFRRQERLFSHFHKAERWIDRHLAKLIGAR